MPPRPTSQRDRDVSAPSFFRERTRRRYGGAVGADPVGVKAPHRGQCVHSASKGVWQDTQIRAAVAVATGDDAAWVDPASAAAPSVAFLNSFTDFPRLRASSGSFWAPNRSRAMNRMTINS